ncbi:jg19900 [Pararge aegeria aegeria]|uniref:Jg19900 protein n=1 Tax=Pararge aegeria aegeria TaxID=348720 RepID=A0A8S4SL70_9NEOP|nr:jg19900 [Pararge aegeria aegeria]
MGTGRSRNLARTSIVIFLFECYVAAQDYFEEHHQNYQVSTPFEHLKEIPKHFNVKGENAIPTFNKYLNDIQGLASKKNISIVYKVKVDTLIKNKHKNPNKPRANKKSKKYNIPLKKKSMKLSNFEIILRKRANEFGLKQHSLDEMSTATEKRKVIYTTRQTPLGKYKPEIGAVKTKYAKIIRPVKNTEFSLET